jgi:hypothetical protein
MRYYVGSLWHQHCDAFATVVGTRQEIVERELDRLATDEFNYCADIEAGHEDDIMTGGVFETDTVDNYVDDVEECLADLAEHGIHSC